MARLIDPSEVVSAQEYKPAAIPSGATVDPSSIAAVMPTGTASGYMQDAVADNTRDNPPDVPVMMSAIDDLKKVAGQIPAAAGMVNQGVMDWINVLHPSPEKNTLIRFGKLIADEYNKGTLTEDAKLALKQMVGPFIQDVKDVVGPISEGEFEQAGEVVARRPFSYALDLATVLSPEARSAAGAAANVTGKAVRKGATKAASVIFGPSEENIAARIANSKAVRNARPPSELAQSLPDAFETLDGNIRKASEQALITLSDKAEDGYSPNVIISLLDRAKKDMGKIISQSDEKAVKVLENYKENIQNAYMRAIPGKTSKVLDASGKPIATEADIIVKKISPREFKQIIQKIDADTNYDTPMSKTANDALKGLRHDVDDILKTDNDAYRAAMIPLDRKVRLKINALRATGVKHRPGIGYEIPDSVAAKIENLHKGSPKDFSLDTLGDFAAETGLDLPGESALWKVRQGFEGNNTNGARNTLAGGVVGKFIGDAVGDPNAGVAAGALMGYATDKIGPRGVAKAIDTASDTAEKAAEVGKKVAKRAAPVTDIVKKIVGKVPKGMSTVQITRAFNKEKKDHPDFTDDQIAQIVIDEANK